MAISEIRLPPGELERLAECVLEPIRFPGAVQPHGLLLVVRRDDLVITQVSDNAQAVVGADPVALLGLGLADLIGREAVDELPDILDPASVASNPARTEFDGAVFDVIVHDVGASLIVELEPLVESDENQIAVMRVSFRRLANATTVDELWEQTAIEVRRVTGFDHVMVYHFHPDEHGEIVGESIADGMEPYLGLHYPASDIPAQARQLYLSKLSRSIVNSSSAAAAMLSDANVQQSGELDMSGAELRAVSPHHLEFMRNMGQVSTFSLSIVRNGRLVGMITCAHRSERRIPYGVREGLEILANQVALQLGAMVEIDRLGRRNDVRQVRARLLAQVDGRADIADALLTGDITVLDLVPAGGATVQLGGAAHSIGTAPSPAQLDEFIAEVFRATGTLDFVSNAIPLDYPQWAGQLPQIAGVLVRRLGGDGDYVAWYRGEVNQSVNWLGDTSPGNRLTPLSPRNSFSAWTEDVTGTSLPWGDLADEASELCRDLDSALLHRAQSQLAELALRDPLTGLPNRRLFMDRLEHSLARSSRGDDLAVLFIDLDRFKAINDSLGHAVGDDVLVRVATTLTAAARSGDTVARLGGDEFVVLCEHVSAEEAQAIGDRMLAGIHSLSADDAGLRVSASIGIAIVDADSSASQILTKADTAMYRAKELGRDQVTTG
jgi:chemotaxis family two-component system sensor kinase Cph1